MRRRILQVFTGIVLGIAIVAGIFLLAPVPSADAGWEAGAAPPSPYPAPGLELPDLEGSPVNLASFRGRAAVVFFGFSNCPDVCPATLLTLSRALDELSERERDRVQVVFVTVDPDRDTPERLHEWMENFHPSILTLRGTEEEVMQTARDWGVHVARMMAAPHDGHQGHDHSGARLPEDVAAAATPGAPGAYSVDHSARSFVVDRSGRVVVLLAPFADPLAVARDLKRAMR